MNGIERINGAFNQANALGRAAFMPYYTVGYPTIEGSLSVVETIANSGADLIELGIPFSDPLADGPTIQFSTQVALRQGATVNRCLEMVQVLRHRGVRQPLLLMGYVNPILAYGKEQFIHDIAEVGADGLIVPDLPVEEANELEFACRNNGVALVYLVAPTTPTMRIKQLCNHSTGFIYLISVNGVTGVRQHLPPHLHEFIARVRQETNLPLAVGFGISKPEQAVSVGKVADGVIIGSAFIDAIRKSKNLCEAASKFMQAYINAFNDIRAD